MSLYAMFKTSEEHEKGGIVLDYGEAGKIRVARAGGSNAKYGKLLGAKMKPYRRQIENETLADQVAEKIMAEVYAATVVLGWEGVDDEKGKPLEFTVENCVKLFTDLPELFRDIQDQAKRAANFRAEDIKDDIKN